MEETKIKPPVRAYVVTARIDKKGTNTASEAKGVLKGSYDEGTKALNYSLEYSGLDPISIALRSGAKGSVGTLIREIYQKSDKGLSPLPIKGGLILTSLQERNLLKGLWFVTVSTSDMNPEISGVLTLKQQQ